MYEEKLEINLIYNLIDNITIKINVILKAKGWDTRF